MGKLDEASEYNTRALAALTQCGDSGTAAISLNRQGSIALGRGEIQLARDYFSQALAQFETLGDEIHTAIALDWLAETAFADGKPAEALQLVSQALETDSRRGINAIDVAIRLSNCIAYRLALGDLDGAHKAAVKAVHAARRAQYRFHLAAVLEHFSLLIAQRGDVRTAGRLLGRTDAMYDELGEGRQPTECWSRDKLCGILREHLTEAEIRELTSEGAMWSDDYAAEVALEA